MKKLISLLLIFHFYQCTPQNKRIEDSGYLLLLLEKNLRNTAGGSSVLTIQKIDFVNYSGLCLDSFFGTSARDYFILMGLSIRNSDLEKSAVSDTNCTNLGLRNFGPRKKTEIGIEYSVHDCGPLTTACSLTSIRAVGF